MDWKSFFPRSKLEIIPFVFMLCIIPITYWFEIWIVLPNLYSYEKRPTAYAILFAIGHFLLFNVVGNLLGVIVVDTSIRGRVMPEINSSNAASFCDVCNTATPPRSYHCPTCKTCILRRDHHCLFTGCCVGHYNYRFFLMFLFFMFLSTALCSPFNLMFMWEHLTYNNFTAVAKVWFPAFMIFWGWSFTDVQLYLILCCISVAAMFFIGAWFWFHWRLAVSGKIVHEMRRNINLYDNGAVENLKEVLGERWYLVWFSPFIKSTLTCDGINFETKRHFQ